MDDDLATNYSIRNWLRHNRRYPIKDTDEVKARSNCAMFVISAVMSLFAVYIAWIVITWPTMQELEGGAPRPLDADDLVVAFQIVALPFIMCTTSLYRWLKYRRRCLSGAQDIP